MKRPTPRIEICSNGAIIRQHNVRINVIECKEGEILIQAFHYKPESVAPSCSFDIVRGIRRTNIKFSPEDIRLISLAYIQYKESKK